QRSSLDRSACTTLHFAQTSSRRARRQRLLLVGQAAGDSPNTRRNTGLRYSTAVDHYYNEAAMRAARRLTTCLAAALLLASTADGSVEVPRRPAADTGARGLAEKRIPRGRTRNNDGVQITTGGGGGGGGSACAVDGCRGQDASGGGATGHDVGGMAGSYAEGEADGGGGVGVARPAEVRRANAAAVASPPTDFGHHRPVPQQERTRWTERPTSSASAEVSAPTPTAKPSAWTGSKAKPGRAGVATS
ncbi:unnamed protein product, partial [Ectocarpus sp. 12 AP-2014]